MVNKSLSHASTSTFPYINCYHDLHYFMFKASTLPTESEVKELTNAIADQITMSKGKRNELIDDLWNLHELAWSTSRD